MKTSYLLAFGIVTGVYSQLSIAGEITDTYTTGDTLTAATLETIKSAVNDNDTRVQALETIFAGDAEPIVNDLFLGSIDQDWSITPPSNPYFFNCTISAGTTLTVPAGTTIRCSGSFTNRGTLRVLPGPTNVNNTSFVAGSFPPDGMQTIAHPGDTPGAASIGSFNNIPVNGLLPITGGNGGLFIPRSVAMTSFGNFKFGGGSGGSPSTQSKGGGLVKIYANAPIVNTGTIEATGDNFNGNPVGSGGGGGGIVILASRSAVINSGTIDVRGADGGTNQVYAGNGGGGGGGIIVMASPTTPQLGVEIVSGGSGGASNIQLIRNTRLAGSGGGGSGGSGGSGGNVDVAGFPFIGSPGGPGYVISLTLDPIALAR